MRKGLYKVGFDTPRGQGLGVIYAASGKIYGGDNALSYVGAYTLEGDKMTAKLAVERHTRDPKINNVFGADHVKITLNGKSQDDAVKCEGSVSEAPGFTFQATLSRISD